MRSFSNRTLLVAALAASSIFACTSDEAATSEQSPDEAVEGSAPPQEAAETSAPGAADEAAAAAGEGVAADEAAAAAGEGVAPDEAAGAPAEADVPAEAPSAVLQPIRQTAHQPCEISIDAPGSPEQECFSIEQVRVAGQPVDVCLQSDGPYAFTYNEQGRLVSDGWRNVTHHPDGTASIAGEAEAVYAVTFDDAGRFLEFGESRYRYDEHGRRIRTDAEGSFESVTYAPDGTSTSDHNYADSDEFCVADITAVEGDPIRPSMQKVERCEINEVPRTVRYTRDAYGRVTTFTVDARNDGTVDATATVSYDCHGG